MSLYNLIYGVSSATFVILPMLGKHPEEYPRFRDCFLEPMGYKLENEFPIMAALEREKPAENCIYVFTRMGGGNEETYQKQVDELRAMPEYIEDIVIFVKGKPFLGGFLPPIEDGYAGLGGEFRRKPIVENHGFRHHDPRRRILFYERNPEV